MPLVGFFYFRIIKKLIQDKKIKKIVNKFLLARVKFMPKIQLRQPTAFAKAGFTSSACGRFSKNKEIIQKFKETRDSRYICQNELDKGCIQHGMAYVDFKDFSRRTASDKILRGKAFNIAKNSKYDGYHRALASILYIFF